MLRTPSPTRPTSSGRRSITAAPLLRAGNVAALLLAAATVVQAAGNLLFHGIASRSLGGSSYAELVTLLTVVLLVSVPLGAVQAAVTAARARSAVTDHRPLMRRLVRRFAVATAVIGAASWPIAAFLHLRSITSVLLVAPYVLAAGMTAAWRGVHLGDGRTGLVAGSVLAATSARVVLGLVLTASFGLAGGLWATLLGELVGWIVLAVRSPRRAVADANLPALEVAFADSARSLVAVTGLWLFTGIDALLARHFLPAVDADAYLSATVVARSVLAIPAALVMASVATFAGQDAPQATRAATRVGAMVAAWAVAVTAVLAIAGDIVQSVVFGDTLTPHVLLVALGAVAGVSGMVSLLTHFHLARRSAMSLLPWVGALVEVLLIVVFHATALQVAMASAGSLLVAVAVMAVSVRNAAAPVAVVSPTAAPAVASIPWADDDTLWQPAEPAVELSVVVPFYNPGPSVGRTVQSIVDLMRAENVGFEVIAVSDGATDGSEAHVRAVDADEVRLVVQTVNQGKGAAVQRGFSSARGRYVAFIDADGDIDPVHLVQYLHRIREGGDMVYASKRHPETRSDSSPFRKLVSWGFMTLTGGLFRLGAGDTQTGCKVMRRELVADVLPWMQERRFAMDLELFVVAVRRGFTDLRPAPVHLGERLSGSTVTAKAVLRTLRDALTIWHRRHVLRAYPARLPGTASSSTPALALIPA